MANTQSPTPSCFFPLHLTLGRWHLALELEPGPCNLTALHLHFQISNLAVHLRTVFSTAIAPLARVIHPLSLDSICAKRRWENTRLLKANRPSPFFHRCSSPAIPPARCSWNPSPGRNHVSCDGRVLSNLGTRPKSTTGVGVVGQLYAACGSLP